MAMSSVLLKKNSVTKWFIQWKMLRRSLFSIFCLLHNYAVDFLAQKDDTKIEILNPRKKIRSSYGRFSLIQHEFNAHLSVLTSTSPTRETEKVFINSEIRNIEGSRSAPALLDDSVIYRRNYYDGIRRWITSLLVSTSPRPDLWLRNQFRPFAECTFFDVRFDWKRL